MAATVSEIRPVRTRPSVSAEAKLTLMEAVFPADDASICAQKVVAWLAEHAGVHHSMVAMVDPEAMRLFEVACQGVLASQAGEFTLNLHERDHPFVNVLYRRQPVYFRHASKQPTTPLGPVAFHAIPLRGRDSKEPMAGGLLFAASGEGGIDPDVKWCAELLADKLLRLRSRQHSAEGRSARERALLYTIINAVTDPILLTDTEGRLIIANSRAEALFAAREEQSEGRRRAVAMNNMLFSSALSSRVMDQTEPATRELVLVDPEDGSDLLFELLCYTDKTSGETGVVSILRNVTDLGRATAELEENYRRLRSAEAEVRAERDRLDLIIHSVADPIIVTDPAGDIILMNTPAKKLFVMPTEGGSDEARYVRANGAHFSSFVSNLLFSGTAQRYRGELMLSDPASGSAIPVEAISGKSLTDQGELTAVVTILHDRTEALEKARLYEQVKRGKEELEEKVQAATAELATENELLRRQHIALEQASALKTQFLANMSHELRTPLNAVLGYTSMLLEGVGGEVSGPQRRSLARIDSNSRHLLSIINEILDVTRIESGRMPLNVSEFRLKDLVGEVMAELEPIIARSKLAVSTDLEPNLPVMRSDRQKVKQILLNLLSNALKFTHEGWVKIEARYDRPARTITIAVSDTGIGIASSDQEKVFEQFGQADSSLSRAYGGAGLGLSICRRLGSMLGGRIVLRSEPARGSTFTLHVPARLKRR